MLCLTQDTEERSKVTINTATNAHELLIKAQALNLGNEFNEDAFEILSQVVKMDPYLMEAWSELTECYQKKSNIDGAIECLEKALHYCDQNKPNKVILRKLSTCIRQKNCDNQGAKIANLLRSLELSKQALRVDLYDEENYYNLAKAYMCLFFVTECVDQQLINLSRAAYVKALTLSNEKLSARDSKDIFIPRINDPCLNDNEHHKLESVSVKNSKPLMKQSDFLFNYATVLVYLQEFQQALEYLREAINLDESWEEPKLLEECLVDYLKQINSISVDLSKNNKKIVRRYSKIIEPLKNVKKIETIIQLDQQRLRKSLNTEVRSISLDELESMPNVSTGIEVSSESAISTTVQLLHLKLLNTINYNQAMYLTFIGIDQHYSLIVVTIYNLSAQRCPNPREVVTIVEPKIEKISVSNLMKNVDDSSLTYKRINVRKFKDVYVNGHRITADQVSKPQFKVTVLT